MNDYERTVQAIKKLHRVPSSHEWDKIAIKFNFLSTRTLRVIFGKSFFEVCREIRKKETNIK